MKYVIFSRDSIMRLPTGRLFLNTEAWTKTEKQNSRSDYPIGKFSIICITGRETETSRLVHWLVILPVSWDWDWDCVLSLYGALGRRKQGSLVSITGLDMESVYI